MKRQNVVCFGETSRNLHLFPDRVHVFLLFFGESPRIFVLQRVSDAVIVEFVDAFVIVFLGESSRIFVVQRVPDAVLVEFVDAFVIVELRAAAVLFLVLIRMAIVLKFIIIQFK